MLKPSCLASLLLAAVLLFFVPAHAAERVVLLEASMDNANFQTALILSLSEPAPYRLQTLQNPNRLVLDLPPIDWLMPPARLEKIAGDISGVNAVRYGWFRPGTYRIVLDLDGPINVQQPSLRLLGSAFQLKFEWQQSVQYRRQQFGTHADLPVPKQRPILKNHRRKPLIVLDPGHGGVDPGAIGVFGTQEKSITLRAAIILADQLRASGDYDVQLTRSSDRFLKLRERVEIARNAKADLFISLHADSAGSQKAQGLSVYSLSEKASDRTAEALASRENKADVIAGVDLSDERAGTISILIDLAQRETMNRSVRFANQLLQSTATRVPILSRAHRQAGFAVLKAPDTPAVLVELGFLSNPDEEQLLNSAIHLTQIAKGVSAAIDNFFSDQLGNRQQR